MDFNKPHPLIVEEGGTACGGWGVDCSLHTTSYLQKLLKNTCIL